MQLNRTLPLLSSAIAIVILTCLLIACGSTAPSTSSATSPVTRITPTATVLSLTPTATAPSIPTATPSPMPTVVIESPSRIYPIIVPVDPGVIDPHVSPGKLPKWDQLEISFAAKTLSVILTTVKMNRPVSPLVSTDPAVSINNVTTDALCGQPVRIETVIVFCRRTGFNLVDDKLANIAMHSLPAAHLLLLEAAAGYIWQIDSNSNATLQQRECGAGWLTAVLISAAQTTKEYRDQIKNYLANPVDFNLGYARSIRSGGLESAC